MRGGILLIALLLAPLAYDRVAIYEDGTPQVINTKLSTSVPSRSDILPASEITFGVYDPHATFAEERGIGIEHIFLFWKAFDSEALRKELLYAGQRDRRMMVTVEPYTKAANWRDGGERLLPDVAAGAYDDDIDRVCSTLQAFRGQLLIRWGHEMEKRSDRYPWAGRPPADYKAAYRHFVDTCRRFVPGAAFVWSPLGEKNLAEYYPGGSYVDIIGVSLWALQKMDATYFGGPRNFEQIFAPKYRRIAPFRKPVMVAELGVSGDRAYRDHWFESLYGSLATPSEFPELRAVVYFNDKEPYHWPMDLGSPDWRIASGWFSAAKEEIEHRNAALR